LADKTKKPRYKMTIPTNKTFIRHCNDCLKIYKPTGKYQKYCESCKTIRRHATIKIQREKRLCAKKL